MKKLLTLLLSILLLIGILAAETSEKNIFTINKWLKTNVVNLSKPVFACENDVKKEIWSEKEFLNNDILDINKIHPAAKTQTQWDENNILSWQKFDGNQLVINNPDTNKYTVSYVAFYLKVEKWMKISLNLKSSQMLKLWIDEKEIGKKESNQKLNEEIKDFDNKIGLETGIHKVLIKIIGGKSIMNYTLSGEIIYNENKISLTRNPVGFMTVDKLLFSESVTNVRISYDGEYSAISLAKVDKETKTKESWIDIRNSDNGEMIRSFRGGMKISSITWSPNKNEFIYKTYDNDKSNLWLSNIETGKNTKILADIKSMGYFEWSPSGDFLIYSVNQEGKEEKSGVKLLNNMPDRQPGNRSVSYLYKLNIRTGITERLTFGKLSTSIHDISEDGKRLLISRYHSFVIERPFSITDYYILNLETMKLDSLFSLKWANSLQFSPDGEKLLITGGVSMFDGIGLNLPNSITPNDYDGQAFIYYLKSKKVLPISKNFNPSIGNVNWSKINNNIYLVATDRSWKQLYEYNVDKNRFSKLNIGMEAISKFALASQATKGVYYGSSASKSFKVCTISFGKRSFLGLKQDDFKVIYQPAKKTYKNTKLSEVKRWTFTNKDGVEIEGRYYLPPDFDATKKYPCIVYYYGGTSPVTRDFDGRYPKNYWSANGYVVYVLQPSGATGFGQEFAAKHVNEWGAIVPDEIIMGTEKFVKAHPFVDGKRLGCIGASYGGFTTESLITKTDMFAAAVSHAGISAVPSYWGEGYWGYSYGAVANANSFPWSHPNVFMKNSALYHADKINTPLLMTHGTADTNVPPGESIQLYTALKLLNKEVEFLQCKDQNHFILEYGQREIWSKSIVAWFDKHLKNDADWWNEIYKDK